MKKMLFLSFLQINESKSTWLKIQLKVKDYSNLIKEKYSQLNEYKIIKYGKYLLFIPIVYFPSKKYILYKIKDIEKSLYSPNNYDTIPFTDIPISYMKENYRQEQIIKYKIGEEILNELKDNTKLKNEFLLHNPQIEMENVYKVSHSNGRFKTNFYINTKNKNKYELDKILGSYLLEDNPVIYEVETENNLGRISQNKEFNLFSYLKCPIVAAEHGLINYYLNLKENKNTEIIRDLYENITIFNNFIDILSPKNTEFQEELENLISKCDFTKTYHYETKMFEKKLKDMANEKNITSVNINKNNITDEDMNEQIQLLFDKITDIIWCYNSDESNILKHINTPFFFLNLWNTFKFYLIDKEYKKVHALPDIDINAPIITPRPWGTLNYFDNTINLRWLGGHFHHSYFTLDKNKAINIKNLIEEWVKKYYISKNPNAYSLSANMDRDKRAHFHVSLKEHK